MTRRPWTDAELDEWVRDQLANAPDPSVDPERCARLARLLGLADHADHDYPEPHAS